MTFDFMKLLTIFSLRVLGAFEKLSEAKGFVETFETFDKSRWSVETDYLLCLSGAHCVYLQSSNFHHFYGTDAKNDRKYFIQLELGNNCREDFTIYKCCEKEYCTPFTSANVVSKEKFKYGSFRVYANAAYEVSGLKDAIHEIWSCFYLDSSIGQTGIENATSISMCLLAGPGPSKEVAIIYQHGDAANGINVHIPFNARNVGIIYRIDWTSNLMEWFINGQSVHKVTSEEFPIPSVPLYWKTGIFPTIDWKQDILPEVFANLGSAVVRSNIYRMRYIAISEIESHDELFVKNESIDKFVPAMKRMILLVSILTFWKLYQSSRKVRVSPNTYTLMDSDSER